MGDRYDYEAAAKALSDAVVMSPLADGLVHHGHTREVFQRLLREHFEPQQPSVRQFLEDAGMPAPSEEQQEANLRHNLDAMDEPQQPKPEPDADRLRDAILWALGQNGDFPTQKEGQGAYWWRKELRRRAGIDKQQPEPDADTVRVLHTVAEWDRESFVDTGPMDNPRQEYRCSLCNGCHEHEDGCPMPDVHRIANVPLPKPAEVKGEVSDG